MTQDEIFAFIDEEELENDEVLEEVNTDFHQSEHHEDDRNIHSDWESEGEGPLSVLQIQQRGLTLFGQEIPPM